VNTSLLADEALKFAVMVPSPSIVADVEADVESVITIVPSRVQDENV
jgi:hypothetical protein